jgi:cupin domain
MFYNVLKVKDIVDLGNEKFERKVLMEHDNSNLSIIAMKKNEIIDTHTSTCDAAVYVLEGEIELHFDAEKFEVDKGEILMFKKDEQHKVIALKDSKFLLIKI